MSSQPVIFNIQYTPYSLPRSATSVEREAHAEKRSFYDMTGGKNIYEYMNTEGKRTGKSLFKSMFEYLQKNTGVFNDKGMIPEQEVSEMKARLKANKGNIYHGFISLAEEDSYKIETPEKCIEFIKRTFPNFFRDARFHKDNIDLMCALHKDKSHLHIHFVFWEKEPKYKSKDGTLTFRRYAQIDKKAIDNMFVRMELYLDDRRGKLYKSRTEAVKDLKEMLRPSKAMNTTQEIREAIIALAKDLPKDGRLSYGSENMKPYRDRVDRIVQMLLRYDRRARQADKKFWIALEQRKRAMEQICSNPSVYSQKNVSMEKMENDPKRFQGKIDEEDIHVIEQIEEDYRRRQGNLVLNLAKYIKPKLYEGKKIYNANDVRLKKLLGISRRNVNAACKKLFLTFGKECEEQGRSFSHRLEEIEEEIAREREERERKNREDYKN